MPQSTRHDRQQQRARQARNRRILGWGVMAVILAFLVIAVVSYLRDDGSSDGTADASSAVRVSMTEFAFSPDPIVLRSGAGARLEAVNDGAVAHNLLVGELGKGTPNVAPGDSSILDLSDQPPGTYRVVCDLPGHTEAGMVTELTLT